MPQSSHLTLDDTPSDSAKPDTEISSFQSDAVDTAHRRGRRSDRKPRHLETKTLAEVLADPDTANGVRWLVDELIPQGALTVLYGIGKGGKTTLLTHLAAAVVNERTFLDRETRSGPVLWIDLEQNISLTAEKLEEAKAAPNESRIHIYNGPAPTVSSIEAAVRDTGAIAVVIDSLSRLLCLRDENDASEVNRTITPLLNLCHATDSAVIAIHHDRKREGQAGRNIRGSSAFLAALDVAIGLRADGSASNRRILECVGRYPAVAGKTLSIALTDAGYVVEGGEAAFRSLDALDVLGDQTLTVAEWATQLGLSRTSLIPRAQRLLDEKRVTRVGAGTKGDPYRYRVAPDPVDSAPPADSRSDTVGVTADV